MPQRGLNEVNGRAVVEGVAGVRVAKPMRVLGHTRDRDRPATRVDHEPNHRSLIVEFEPDHVI